MVFQSEQTINIIYIFPENHSEIRNMEMVSSHMKTAQALEIGRPGFLFCTCHLTVGKDKLLNFYETQCLLYETMVVIYGCYDDQ